MSELRPEEHFISEQIWERRPYVRYDPGNRDPIRQEYDNTWMTGLAGQSGGYLMMRHPPPGLGLGYVYAEIRPDDPVWTGPGYWHFHPSVKPPKDFVPMIPERVNSKGELLPAKPLSPRYVSTFRAMNKSGHIDRDKGNPYDHRGVNNEDVHFHRPRGKYVFPAGDAKAKRIDVHPLSVALFENAEVVFLALEGVVKADAILTAILDSGARAAVFSVPSVTLWRAPELRSFAARYLAGKVVYVVPDSDWHNHRVVTQAICCRTELTKLGVHARVAIPTRGKGVDDHLFNGGTLAELEVIGRDFPNIIELWRRFEQLYARRLDDGTLTLGHEGTVARSFINHIAAAVHAGDDGTFQMPLASLARVLGVPPRRLQRAAQDLLEVGPWTADRPLKTVSGAWKGRYFDRSEQWDGRTPKFTIETDFRATPTTPVPLSEDLGENFDLSLPELETNHRKEAA